MRVCMYACFVREKKGEGGRGGGEEGRVRSRLNFMLITIIMLFNNFRD